MLAHLIPLAAPIIRHASEGPSATPLIVELVAAAAVGVIFFTRRPVGRAARATYARLTRTRRAATRTAPSSGR